MQLGYGNINVYLDTADESFGKISNPHRGTSSTGLTTSDDGKRVSARAINVSSE